MKRRFTVIELVVVLAIVLILGAMLFPAIGRAKAAAQAKKAQETHYSTVAPSSTTPEAPPSRAFDCDDYRGKIIIVRGGTVEVMTK
jgi:Tfp pilus assembly protein PilE